MTTPYDIAKDLRVELRDEKEKNAMLVEALEAIVSKVDERYEKNMVLSALFIEELNRIKNAALTLAAAKEGG